LKNLPKKSDDWEVDTFRTVFPDLKVTFRSIERMLSYIIKRRKKDANRISVKTASTRFE